MTAMSLPSILPDESKSAPPFHLASDGPDPKARANVIRSHPSTRPELSMSPVTAHDGLPVETTSTRATRPAAARYRRLSMTILPGRLTSPERYDRGEPSGILAGLLRASSLKNGRRDRTVPLREGVRLQRRV